jgi:hypothetical protein
MPIKMTHYYFHFRLISSMSSNHQYLLKIIRSVLPRASGYLVMAKDALGGVRFFSLRRMVHAVRPQRLPLSMVPWWQNNLQC